MVLQRFEPATKKPYPLGRFVGCDFEVVPSNKSSFRGFELVTSLPCLCLSISVAIQDGVKTPTWSEWDPLGVNICHVVAETRRQMSQVVRHFFADALLPEDAEYRIKLNSVGAARRPHPHFILDVGHKELWPGFDEENSLVCKIIDSTLAPRWIVEGVLDTLKELAGSDREMASLFFGGDERGKVALTEFLMQQLELKR